MVRHTFLEIGQDGIMPRLIQPDFPPEVEMAISLMGSRAQAAILRALSISGPDTIGSLLGQVGVGRPSLNRLLVEMEKSGVITGRPEPGSRHGKSVYYEAVPSRVEELVSRYIEYTLNRSS